LLALPLIAAELMALPLRGSVFRRRQIAARTPISATPATAKTSATATGAATLISISAVIAAIASESATTATATEAAFVPLPLLQMRRRSKTRRTVVLGLRRIFRLGIVDCMRRAGVTQSRLRRCSAQLGRRIPAGESNVLSRQGFDVVWRRRLLDDGGFDGDGAIATVAAIARRRLRRTFVAFSVTVVFFEIFQEVADVQEGVCIAPDIHEG
jgi:hypothetical protein